MSLLSWQSQSDTGEKYICKIKFPAEKAGNFKIYGIPYILINNIS